MFYDATSFTSTIVGPIFNGTFDKTNIKIQNHPDGIITIVTEKSVRIKLTMSGGVHSKPVNTSLLNGSFEGAMYVGSENISTIVAVRTGSLMMAGERSIIVDLAKGGVMIFRAATDTSEGQSQLLDDVLRGDVIAEYWAMTRDDGAIYSMVSYDDIDFTTPNVSVKLGSWTLKLPRQVEGNVTIFHLDKMSLTIAGGAEAMFSMNKTSPTQVDDIGQIQAAARNGSNALLYYEEATGSSVFLTLFVPTTASATEPVDTGGENTNNEATLNVPISWLVVGGIAAVAVVAGAALLIRRSRKK
jgi:hypothetical protein